MIKKGLSGKAGLKLHIQHKPKGCFSCFCAKKEPGVNVCIFLGTKSPHVHIPCPIPLLQHPQPLTLSSDLSFAFPLLFRSQFFLNSSYGNIHSGRKVLICPCQRTVPVPMCDTERKKAAFKIYIKAFIPLIFHYRPTGEPSHSQVVSL